MVGGKGKLCSCERHGGQVGCTALSEDKSPIQGAIEAYEDPFGKGLYMATFKQRSLIFFEADGLDYMGVIAAAQYNEYNFLRDKLSKRYGHAITKFFDERAYGWNHRGAVGLL